MLDLVLKPLTLDRQIAKTRVEVGMNCNEKEL